MLFIHIPKTAGSSFRLSFESKAITYKDYGKDSISTSEQIKTQIYQHRDFYAFKSLFHEHQYTWLTGHVPLAKYINFVPVMNTVSFVREPIQQVLSHYNHYVTRHGFEGDLNDFLDRPFAKNLQSKRLKFMPLGLIGCLGITEYYDDSLALINQQFGLRLAAKKVNVNRTKFVTPDLLNGALSKKLKRHNQSDIKMYEEALYLHRERIALGQKKQAWTYGFAEVKRDNKLYGCAYQQNKFAVKLVVKINDVVSKTIIANTFFADFVKVNFPRQRYIGFSIDLPKNLTTEDNIDVYVEGTGQKINFKPLHVH